MLHREVLSNGPKLLVDIPVVSLLLLPFFGYHLEGLVKNFFRSYICWIRCSRQSEIGFLEGGIGSHQLSRFRIGLRIISGKLIKTDQLLLGRTLHSVILDIDDIASDFIFLE